MRRRFSWSLLVPLVFVLAGMLFATSAQTARGNDLRGGERTDLADVIRAADRRLQAQAREVQRDRAQVDALGARIAQGSASVRTARAAADDLEMPAQVRAVRGPGLAVTLDDAPTKDPSTVGPDVTADDLVVHQQDVQAVVNALWAGGAEAMQIMDQRVISTSAVRCVGNVLLLQGRKYSPPYTIKAIGDVQGMRNALDRSYYVNAYRYYVQQVGLGYKVTALGETDVPGYAGSLDLTHATVPTRRRG